MIELSPEDRAKILALKNIRAPIVAEVVAVYWTDETRYYATSPLHIHTPTIPVPFVDARILPEDDESEEIFQEISESSAINDDEIELKFFDADSHIKDLLNSQGEGIKVKLFYWFPQVELFLEHWVGHLRLSDDEDALNAYMATVIVSQGVRSFQTTLPGRKHYEDCQSVWAGLLNAQEQVGNDCGPYDRHLGGSNGTLNPATSQPWTFCPQVDPANCTERGIDPATYLGHRTNIASIANNQTSGPNLIATSRGNETNLKEAVRVVMGYRFIRKMPLLARINQFNNNHPDQGYIRGIWEGPEGPIDAMWTCRVNDQVIGQEHLNIRLGEIRQPPTSFTPGAFNYSGSSLFLAVYGPVNPSSYSNDSLEGSAAIYGLRDVKHFTTPTTYTTYRSNNRAWQLFRMLTDRRWGYGLSESEIEIQDFIDAADWCGRYVRFTQNGVNYDHYRAIADVDLIERTTQQQIEDMSMAGRFSRPFWWGGKLRLMTLSALTEDELAACPVFTDEGNPSEINILFDEDGISTLKHSVQSDRTLENRVEINYDDVRDYFLEKPVSVQDQKQQLKASRAIGGVGRRIIKKPYPSLGIVFKEHAVKYAWSLLDLGMFDEGGLRNNLRISFSASIFECLELHPYKVIKVISSSLQKYKEPQRDGTPTQNTFQYFRILSMNKESNLSRKIVAQAYNKTYMDSFETEIEVGGSVTGTIYEAEDATFGGSASAVSDAACSGGEKVTGLGNGSTLTYSVGIVEAGEYICRFYYKSNSATSAIVTVNSGQPFVLNFPSSSNQVRFVEINLYFSSGANTIYMANGGASFADQDKLFVGYIFIDPGDDGGGGGGCRLTFGEVEYTDGQLVVPIEPCLDV